MCVVKRKRMTMQALYTLKISFLALLVAAVQASISISAPGCAGLSARMERTAIQETRLSNRTNLPRRVGSSSERTAIQETRLSNGLVVLTKENHASPVVCTYVWYRVGSRDETPGISGISHQLEHMMFKGTKKEFPYPGYIDQLVGRNGGENNAQTDTDSTSYYLVLPSDQLDLALRIEADRMTQAAIDSRQLAAEKTVVLSELEGDENDNAYFLYENTRATAYQYHPYHYPVIGTKWDVKHFTREQVYDYYRSHYAPNNATLVVVGDFDTPKMIARVRQLWAGVRPAVFPHPPIDPEPPQRGERRIEVRRAGATAYLEAMYHIPPALHRDLPALTVLATALSSGRSSRLYRALVETQLATGVSTVANEGIDPEVFEISASARAGVKTTDIEKALYAELERVRTQPLEDRELQKAKNQTRADFIFAQESVEAQAARLGFFQTIYKNWRRLNTYVGEIQAVTAADVQRVVQTYLTAENRTVGIFIPNGEKPRPDADSGGGRGVHYRPPKNQTSENDTVTPRGCLESRTRQAVRRNGVSAASAAIGKVSDRRLRNGVRLIVKENHANPTVSIGGFVQAGSVNDPPGKMGVANLTADMLIRGTKTRTSQQIAQETDFVGAHIGVDAGRERTDLFGAMLTENFDAILNLLADVVQNPSFPPDELVKLKGEVLTGLQEQANDTAAVATNRLYEVLYGKDSSYAHEIAGRAEDVGKITVEDVQQFYHQAYRPERVTLVIVGDITAEKATSAVEKAFGDWQDAGEALPKYTPPTKVVQTVPIAPLMVLIPDKSQDDIAMGSVGLSRKTPGYEAAMLMNLILGGDEFVGRIGKRVRDTEGLAYYAYTTFVPGMVAGPWMFRAGVNPQNVSKAIASARDEVRKMATKGMTDAELAWAKDHAIGSLRLSLATNAGIAAQLEQAAFYNLGLDYADRYPQIVRRITIAQVDAAARTYLRPGEMPLVIAGPPVPGLNSGRDPSR
jgi:zinc protease